MLYKKSIVISTFFVFLCSAMEEVPQRAHNELAQRVAQLSLASSFLGTKYVRAENFCATQEHIKALRRAMVPHEHNDMAQGSSSRILGAIDSLLVQAQTHLVDSQNRFKSMSQLSSLSDQDKKTLYSGHLISFQHTLNSLFASLDCNGVCYEDKPCIALKRVMPVDSDGSLLAGIEAVECFAQAVDDTPLLCSSCKNTSQEVWCSNCLSVDRKHSSVTPCIVSVAKETRQRIGVHDTLKYLHSRVGSLSLALDQYMTDDKAGAWQGPEQLRVFADTRKKIILELAALHAYSADLVKNKKDEVASSSSGLVGGLVSGLSWVNPLPLLSTTAKSAGFKALAIDEALVDKISNLWAHYVELSQNEVDFLTDSATDVERFTTLYRKPLREQLLSLECRKQLDLMVHAWKTKGVVAPQNTFLGLMTQHSVVNSGLKSSKVRMNNQEKSDEEVGLVKSSKK